MLNVRYVRQGKGVSSRGGALLGKIEEYFLETMTPGDTFLFAGRTLRFEGIRENEAYVSNATGVDAESADLCRRQVPAVDLSRRPGARHARRPRPVEETARAGVGLAAAAAGKVRAAAQEGPADRDVPARQPLLHGGLRLRRAAGAPDAGHAADPPAGTRRRSPDRLCRHRIFARRLGPGRHGRHIHEAQTLARRTLRRGHAGRRPRRVAGGKLAA